jgi:hypothetical protein
MRNLTLTIHFCDISQSFVSATKYENTSIFYPSPAKTTIVYNARIFYRGVCRYVFCVWEYSGKATVAVRRYANACIRANGGHLL